MGGLRVLWEEVVREPVTCKRKHEWDSKFFPQEEEGKRCQQALWTFEETSLKTTVKRLIL